MKNLTRPEDRATFAAALKKWQGNLNLQDWRVELADKPAVGAMASVERSYADRLGSFRLGKSFGSMAVTPETIEATALHEILHLFLYELMEVCSHPQARQEDKDSVEHRVINVLEKLLLAPSPEARHTPP